MSALTMPSLNRLRNGLLVGRLFPIYVLLGLLKHVVPLGSLVRWAWCPATVPRNRETERRFTVSVVRMSQLRGLPDRDCLQRSLLLYRMLSRAGADPTLVVGFQRSDSRIIGHAWVVVDGRAVIEPDADLVRFSARLHFGSRGTLLPE
jgi:hypothetical protein